VLRVKNESLWFQSPVFACELKWREAFERFEPSKEIVRVNEIVQMSGQLFVAFVMVAFGGGSQALLTTLCRSRDRLSRGGAPMYNLSHSAFFQLLEKIAPSNSGIKHLVSVDDIAWGDWSHIKRLAFNYVIVPYNESAQMLHYELETAPQQRTDVFSITDNCVARSF